MKRLGIFIDVSNLYYCVEKQYRKKIDYQKYIEYLKDFGQIKFSIAYAAVMGTQADGFLHALRDLGFEVKTRTPKEYTLPGGGVKHKCDFDVQIALDMVHMQPQMDMCILGSADGDLTPAVKYMTVPTVIFACGISNELAKSAKTAIEIPPSLLIG
jgi:uncharacterized LabA/DUF88 family protein